MGHEYAGLITEISNLLNRNLTINYVIVNIDL